MSHRILFVCLGNICRSPLAEGVFLHLAREAGSLERYRIDSAGTSAYHAGEEADRRSIDVAQRNGFELPSRSRKVRPGDFTDFDLIVAMDAQNEQDLRRMCPDGEERRIRRMREWDPEGDGDVPDPYYGGPGGFDRVYEMLLRSCRALLDELEG